jgi:putative glycerol-1-phosphate prenyltransferase
LLIDPDDDEAVRAKVLEAGLSNHVELFLVGGSLITEGHTEQCVTDLKSGGARKVVLFPGNEIQLSKHADAILFMSLISGRNPEYLIGKQVVAAPAVRRMGIEAIPTGYMLVDGGKITSAHYISHTLPIPHDKPDIAMATAVAGELLGLELFYLDAGSGAEKPVSAKMISAVAESTHGVVVTGGGIKTASEAEKAWEAGADVVVIGNGAVANHEIIQEMARVLQKINTPASAV